VFWTDAGALSKVRESSRETGPWGTFSVKYRSSSRSAEVTGMVADTELAASFDDAWGVIADVKQMGDDPSRPVGRAADTRRGSGSDPGP
jgi:hypothetical protein